MRSAFRYVYTVNALLIFWLSLTLARHSLALFRRQVPAKAAARL